MRRASDAALAAPYPDPDSQRAHGVRGGERERPTRSSSEWPSGTRSRRRWSATSRWVFFGEDVAARRRCLQGHPRATRTLRREPRLRQRPSPSWRSPAPRSARRFTGLRPVFEIMFGDFMGLAMEQPREPGGQVSGTSSNEQGSVPLVVRSAVGGGGRFRRDPLADARHLVPGHSRSQDRRTVEPRRGKRGMLKGAIRDDKPGDLPRAQAPLLGEGPARPRTGEPVPPRRGARRPGGRPT